MRTTNLILALALGVTPSLWAVGKTSADFLNMGVGPRAIAMGDAQVGLADDAYAAFWNPAGLSTLKTQEASFVHTNYVQSISQQSLAYAYPHPRYGAFGLSLNYVSYGSINGFDSVGQSIGNVTAHDVDAGLSYSRNLYKDERYGTEFSAGVTGKWIQESLASVKASAFAGDVGLLFIPGLKYGEWLNGWKTGLALRNMGPSMTFDQESFSLPRQLAAGVSYTGHWRDELITVAVDGRQPHDGARTMGVGLELWTLKTLVLRAGYTTEGDLGNGLRFGGGLRFKTVQVDYAFASQGTLGATHRFGLTLRFTPPKPSPLYLSQRSFDQGMRHYKKNRYSEALIEFSNVLEHDPANPQAIEMMKKTYEKLKNALPE